MVGQSGADARFRSQKIEQFADVELTTDVEIGVFVGAKELEQIAPSPSGDVEIVRHAGIVA
jgi:hypothetical protein